MIKTLNPVDDKIMWHDKVVSKTSFNCMKSFTEEMNQNIIIKFCNKKLPCSHDNWFLNSTYNKQQTVH